MDDFWVEVYLCWEMWFLDDLGFGLDLGSCVVMGSCDGLVYVSLCLGWVVSV